jgi:DNA-binding SARP family transcriptional activator
VDFRLLGPLEVRDAAGAVLQIPTGRLRTLLARLLLRADSSVATEDLIDAVWGDQPPREPLAALQVMVLRLRRALGPAAGSRLRTAPPGYRFDVMPSELDLRRFEELLQWGSAALDTQDWTTARDLLGRALACWRGDALADVRTGTAMQGYLDTLAALRLRTQRQLVEARLHLGQHGELVDEITALVESHPFDEQLRAQLMLALHGCGRRAEALEAFRSARRTLVDELGIEPGTELRELHQALLADDPYPPGKSSDGATAVSPVPAADAATGRVLPAQLPTRVPDFTGRSQEAGQLEEQLTKATGAWPSGPVVLSAIDGTGGIGKTSLAVHVAHQVTGLFPDGQLHADLHGSGGRPAEPGEVLARFLRGLGVPPERVPADPEERGALYRTTLASRQVLVLLDNVRDAAQVRPLLPGAGGSAVLITSRSTLPGLDGAFRITLGFLDVDDSLDLFTRIVGHDVVAAEPDAVRAVLQICSGLPLAIRIAASRLAAGLDRSVQELAERLTDERLRLDELAVEDRAIRATFAVSYHGLPADQARAFRLLAVSEGSSVTLPAAAAQLALPRDVTQQLLDALVGIHLLHSPTPGRYRFHDLLRLFAAECAQADETSAAQDAALHRQLRWYLHSSAAASRCINPSRRHVTLDAPGPEWEPLNFTGFDEALAWCEAERTNLAAAVAQAARTGRHEIGWKLPITMWDLFHLRRWQEDGIRCNESALASAEALHDRKAEAWVLNCLSSAYQAAGRLSDAADCLDRALAIRGRLGDLQGQGSSLLNLGYVRTEMGRSAEAIGALEQALGIFRELGVRAGEAVARTNLGVAFQTLGDYPAALEHHQQALAIALETADQFHAGRALTNLADTLFQLGSLEEAADHATRGLETTRVTGNQVDEGIALDILGRVHAAQGRWSLAHHRWRDAYTVLDILGHPRAADVLDRLSSHPM